MKRGLALVAGSLLWAGLAEAARRPPPSTDWAAATALTAESPVEVRTAEGGAHKGRLVQVTADTIVVRTRKGELSVDRAKVREVKVRTGMTRLAKTAIGAGIGAGATFGGSTALLYATGSSFSSDDAPELIAWLTLFGAGIGAAVGALLPEGWWTVYRAP